MKFNFRKLMITLAIGTLIYISLKLPCNILTKELNITYIYYLSCGIFSIMTAVTIAFLNCENVSNKKMIILGILGIFTTILVVLLSKYGYSYVQTILPIPEICFIPVFAGSCFEFSTINWYSLHHIKQNLYTKHYMVAAPGYLPAPAPGSDSFTHMLFMDAGQNSTAGNGSSSSSGNGSSSSSGNGSSSSSGNANNYEDAPKLSYFELGTKMERASLALLDNRRRVAEMSGTGIVQVIKLGELNLRVIYLNMLMDLASEYKGSNRFTKSFCNKLNGAVSRFDPNNPKPTITEINNIRVYSGSRYHTSIQSSIVDRIKRHKGP